MADKRAPEIVKALHEHGYMTRSVQPIKVKRGGKWIWVSPEEQAKADHFVMKNGRSAALEIKNGYNSYRFDELRLDQREWAETYCIAPPYNTPYFIALVIGTDRPNSKMNFRRRAWIIPYKEYLSAEVTVGAYQKTLPYFAGKGVNLEMQRLKIDAITLFEAFELVWTQGMWCIPENNPFSTHFNRR